jgi:hypothetical protein
MLRRAMKLILRPRSLDNPDGRGNMSIFEMRAQVDF